MIKTEKYNVNSSQVFESLVILEIPLTLTQGNSFTIYYIEVLPQRIFPERGTNEISRGFQRKLLDIISVTFMI